MTCRGPLLVLALVTTVAACGARTGLEIPEHDAGHGMDAPRDVGRDAPMDTGHDAARDTGRDAPIDTSWDGPPICIPGEFLLVPTSADVVFTIDRSRSMRLSIDGVDDEPRSLWRWTILRDSLAGAFTTLDPRVNVGAKFYPDRFDPAMPTPPPEESCRTSGGLDVAISPGGRAAIIDVFNTTEAIGGTPTARAIALTAGAMATSASPRRFIVLATDGGPNCNPALMPPCACTGTDCSFPDARWTCLDDVETLRVLDRTFREEGIPVFVVGIEDTSRPDLADVMDEMAEAGGRPREGARRRFYSVRTAEELSEALDVITSTVSRCGFASPSLPPDDSSFSMTVDGEVAPHSDVEGWEWTNRPFGEIELFGSWCDRARRPGARVVAIVEGCP